MGRLEEQPAYSLPTLLDPRFKLRYFENESNAIKAKGDLLLLHQRSPSTTSGPNSHIETGEPKCKRRRVSNENPWKALDDILSDDCLDIEERTSEMEVQLSMYLKETLLPRTEDPLLWWNKNSQRFPNMAILAQTFLASPPTSVPSERVFSTAGDVVSEHRSSLLPENAEMLILLKCNLKFLNDL
jgi:hypothetical protein